jgi:hypothetical protein
LQPGVDKYPASQQEVLREIADRDMGGQRVRASASGFHVHTRNTEPGCFVVKVEKDGGVAGDDETDCSFTYTVKDIYGATLDTEVSPEQSRYPETAYLEAGADDQSAYGIAGYDEDGNLLLLSIDEIADSSEC